jgi:hypothetical protein
MTTVTCGAFKYLMLLEKPRCRQARHAA